MGSCPVDRRRHFYLDFLPDSLLCFGLVLLFQVQITCDVFQSILVSLLLLLPFLFPFLFPFFFPFFFLFFFFFFFFSFLFFSFLFFSFLFFSFLFVFFFFFVVVVDVSLLDFFSLSPFLHLLLPPQLLLPIRCLFWSLISDTNKQHQMISQTGNQSQFI